MPLEIPDDTPNALHFVYCLRWRTNVCVLVCVCVQLCLCASMCVHVCVLQQVQSTRVHFTIQEG